jgi:hypothetical protein
MPHPFHRFAVLSVFLWAALSVTRVSAQANQALRYDWQPNQVFAYSVKIVVDLPDSTETYQGTTNYTVKAVAADSRLVIYQGGLPKAKASKSTGGPRGFGPRGFGPFGPRMGPPPSPFSRSNFRGSEQTTNEITLSPTGKVTSLKNDSQLPYLLGNVSLLPFEPLPDTPRREWKVSEGMAITEKEERSDMRPHFGPFDPFGGGQREEEVQAASESTSYAIAREQGDLVSVSKTYELKSPAPKPGEAGFTFTGTGTWTFNRKLHVSESLHMDLKLVQAKGNEQVTVPITVDYRRLTEDELAKIQAERQRQQEELRKKAEETARAEAEKKRQAEAPLTPEEKQASLSGLQGTDVAALTKVLGDLAKKSPKDPDTQIATAIEPLLKHADRLVREAAHKALLQWSPSYRPRGELDRQYGGTASVESTARVVTKDTPLYVGQILQLKEHWRWVPADILEVLGDGTVKVHPRGWSTNAWDKAVTRENLQLAPDELFQPYKSPTAGPAVALRTWSDSTGTFKIEATYLGLSDGKVQLKRQDGREISVPLDRLSPQDQQYVQQAQQAAKQPQNPFE